MTADQSEQKLYTVFGKYSGKYLSVAGKAMEDDIDCHLTEVGEFNDEEILKFAKQNPSACTLVASESWRFGTKKSFELRSQLPVVTFDEFTTEKYEYKGLTNSRIDKLDSAWS